MTIQSSTSRASYTGDGVSVVFTVPFPFFQNADLSITQTDLTGLVTTISNATISGAGTPSGGTVTLIAPLTTGYKLNIFLAPQILQLSHYISNAPFPALTLETDLDRQVQIDQYLQEQINNGIRADVGEVSPNMKLPAVATRANKYLYFDANGDMALASAIGTGTLSQSTIGGYLTPQTPAELAAGVTPVKTWYAEGDVRRYGAFLDGVIDDTTYLQNWAKVGGNLSFPVAQTAKISAEITLNSNTTIRGAQGAKILQTVADLAIFRSTTTNNVQISGLHFKQATWGAAAYVGHVVFDGVTYGNVIDCEFEGHQWAGAYLNAARHCTVRGNYFHDSFPLQSLNFTAGPAAAATSATLTANWTLPTGGYTVLFTETAGGAHEGKQVTFTNGSTTATWSGGLAANCNAGITVQSSSSSSDIVVFSSPVAAAAYNIIDGNFCYGSTMECGICVQDPYNGVLPTRNIVTNNRITDHLGYGIIVYLPDAGDSYNQVIGNFIENISGLYALNLSTGAGIYVTGAGIGGTVVANNTIRNCCINTANATLAPAAIGIAGVTTTGGVPVSITGNTISDMSQYHGILLTGVGNGATVSGNSIRMPSTNANGHGVTLTNCDGIACSANTIFVATGTQAIRGYLIQGLGGVNCTNISIAGGAVRGGHFTQIETTGTGGGLVVGLSISGVTLAECDSSCIPLQLASATDAAVTGCFMQSSGALVLNQGACLNVAYSGNRFKGGGTNVIQFTGVNTGTFLDRSNRGVNSPGINNAGTGAIVEFPSTAVPASGVFAVGDTVWNSTPTAGGVACWICTTLGTGGGTAVFKTISNS